MKYRKLGDSGLRVSEISLGSHLTFGTTLDDDRTRRCIHRAFDLGINFFDTADGYGDGEAETVLGRILEAIDRGDWVVGTKCFFPITDSPTNRGLSRKHIVESVDRSLARLRIDHIDLMQCHRFDVDTPVEETIETMDLLVRQGKILYWGLGRCSGDQIDEICSLSRDLGRLRPVAHQTSYSLFDRSIEDGVLAASAANGVGNLVYAPLAQGVLTGKYAPGRVPRDSRGADPETAAAMRHLEDAALGRVERLEAVAREAGMTTAALALAWCLRQPAVSSVIVGATRPEQIEENVRASGIELDEELLDRVDRIVSA